MIYVGIDLHRKRSLIAALDEQGTELRMSRAPWIFGGGPVMDLLMRA